MLFRLKNFGATYQHLFNKMFKDQIVKTMEVYVDDILVRILKATTHILDLRETFDILWKYQMKLNLDKCVFGLTSRNFVCVLVHCPGIAVNLAKI